MYTGKDTSAMPEIGLAHTVTKSLLTGFEGKGYTLYMDNFYSSVPLFQELRVMKIGACGTVRSNRKDLPKELKKVKLKCGERLKIWQSLNNTMIACTWQDTGRVNMLSTVGASGVTAVEI